MAEELPVDLRTRRGAPPGRAPPRLRCRYGSDARRCGGEGGHRCWGGACPEPPPGVLALPPPLALLGPPESQLAADIAAATGQDEDGDTALHIAVAQGALGVARLVGLFLRGGRDLDVYNRLRQVGDPPCTLAVITGHPGLVRLLVAHGASPMAPDRLGRTCAHLACESPPAPPRCLRELLRTPPGRGGPDLQARDYEGLTPLHVAVGAGARESVRVLLEHGADIDAADIKSGRSPLLHAVESNDLEMAELLIRHGASVNAQSYAGCTALHAAAGRGLLGVLRLLLRSGADCGLRDYHNETALAVATSRQVIDVLRGKASRPPLPPPAPPNPQGVPRDLQRNLRGRGPIDPESCDVTRRRERDKEERKTASRHQAKDGQRVIGNRVRAEKRETTGDWTQMWRKKFHQ
ncbi:LOW QUALITY PROTEIN: B-cell lymphoma 3 protein [Aegotheles albertisi]